MTQTRKVFFVSDGTGITAETLGHSLMTQFESIAFEAVTLPYIDTVEKAEKTVARINTCATEDKLNPIVFATIANPQITEILKQAQCKFFGLFETYLAPLEQELQTKPSRQVGKTHGIADNDNYKIRIDAVNYALNNDDGLGTHNYQHADIILVGVSRCGKTPTCLYLALRFGILAANYPLTEDDMGSMKLPSCLNDSKQKLFGLTIDPKRLHMIRNERRPDSSYASMDQCRRETDEVMALFKRYKVPFIDTTAFSIEEISTKILDEAGISRRVL